MKLLETIENLYQIFGHYRPPLRMNTCSHCGCPEQGSALYSKALPQLSEGDMGDYASSALTTWGNEQDFKYYLPRLFELLATSKEPWSTPEMLVAKLNYANWTTWPSAEQTALRAFLHALWDAYLEGALVDEDWLCTIAQAESDLSPYLELWRTSNETEPIIQLGKFLQENEHDLVTWQRLSSPFWANHPAAMKSVVAWLVDPDTLRWFESHGGDDLSVISAVEETKERLKKIVWQILDAQKY